VCVCPVMFRVRYSVSVFGIVGLLCYIVLHIQCV
jgi:hypothetical protein